VGQNLLRHVVLLKFSDQATQEQIAEIGDCFVALRNQIETIHEIEWGVAQNNDAAYSHCLLVTFLAEEDMQIYANHPAHGAIPAKFGHLVAAVTVVDYWT